MWILGLKGLKHYLFAHCLFSASVIYPPLTFLLWQKSWEWCHTMFEGSLMSLQYRTMKCSHLPNSTPTIHTKNNDKQSIYMHDSDNS